MTQSLVDWAKEAETWSDESAALARLMFRAGAESWDRSLAEAPIIIDPDPDIVHRGRYRGQHCA